MEKKKKINGQIFNRIDFYRIRKCIDFMRTIYQRDSLS